MPTIDKDILSYKKTVMINGKFRVLNIQNHYPSGTEPQTFGSVIELLNDDDITVHIKFTN